MTDETDDEQIASFKLNDGTEWRLVGWRNVLRWLSELEDSWAWVRKEFRDPDPSGAAGNVASVLDNLSNEIDGYRAQGSTPATAVDLIRRHLNGASAPFHQTSAHGSLVSDILTEGGPDAALFAFAFLRQQVSFAHVSTPAHFRGLMLVSQPALALVSDAAARLNSERNNFRSSTRRLAAEFEEAERVRIHEWNTSLSMAGDAAIAWSQRRAKRWLRYTIAWRKLNDQSIANIRAVEASYREAMALQAPVEYWTKKATSHASAERDARRRLYWYFPIALILITGLFGASAIYLLNVPQAKLPPGLYVIASAGLASAAGLLFWIGRLLTKLYLSEHHLRHDAEERAVMTTTYLALTAEKAASDTDRQIILNSLFRTTSDGIVKEDGGLDPSLASLIAKLGVR